MQLLRPTVCATLVACAAPWCAAQTVEIQTIWRCTDSAGRTHVTNVKEETTDKECKIIQQQRVSVVPAPKPAAGTTASPSASPGTSGAARNASPSGFPREDPAARTSARDRQREILERELDQEQELLGKARKDLAEQESVRGGDERNFSRVLERLKKYRDNVEVHEKNVEALRRELTNLRR
jgi:hypothetical protein